MLASRVIAGSRRRQLSSFTKLNSVELVNGWMGDETLVDVNAGFFRRSEMWMVLRMLLLILVRP